MVSPLRGIKQTQFGGAEWGMYGSESMKNRGASLPPRPTVAAAVAVVVDEISSGQSGIPIFESTAQGAIEGLRAGLHPQVGTLRHPLHLLLLAQALADQDV